MKKILVLVILTVSAYFAKAQTATSCKDTWVLNDSCLSFFGVLDKFTLFKSYLESAKRRSLGDSDSILVVAAVYSKSENSEGEAWTVPINQQSGVKNYAIYVTVQLLRDADSLTLEIAAQHEVCHVELHHLLGPIINQDLAALYEVQVLQCVLAYLGEKKLEQYLTEDLLHIYSQHGNAEKAKALVDVLKDMVFKVETLSVDTLAH